VNGVAGPCDPQNLLNGNSFHAKQDLIVRVLHRYQIDDISLLAYDEAGSQAADWVAQELQADRYRLRDRHFNEGDVVIDIGAHIGLFSIYLAKRWPFLKVFAFEAFPTNYRNCADNLQLNRVKNVVLSPKAIAKDDRVLSMATDPQNSGGASVIVSTFEANGIVADIASMTLHQVFSLHEIRRCKLLKIDCEGMEYEILFGAQVLDRVEYLVGEFHASPSLQSQGWCPERLRAYCSSFLEDDKMAIEFNEIPE
jgi:FkbM family methyltransferase